jgi:hypothetical protein
MYYIEVFVLEEAWGTLLNETGYTIRTGFVLSGTALLLNCFVAQEVPVACGTTHYFAGTGNLKLLRDGFARFLHGLFLTKGGKKICFLCVCKA